MKTERAKAPPNSHHSRTMSIPPFTRKSLLVGTSAGLLHLFLCLAIFASVQSSTDGQAGFAWFQLFILDFPTGPLAYEALGNNELMTNLIDWWYTIGNHQGPNIRAIILFGIFGTLHWFFLGAIAT